MGISFWKIEFISENSHRFLFDNDNFFSQVGWVKATFLSNRRLYYFVYAIAIFTK